VNVNIYVGDHDQEYPDLGITATPGVFLDFGDRPVPQDGLWRAATADELAAYQDVNAINAAINAKAAAKVTAAKAKRA
jgi:hypothetical protein